MIFEICSIYAEREGLAARARLFPFSSPEGPLHRKVCSFAASALFYRPVKASFRDGKTKKPEFFELKLSGAEREGFEPPEPFSSTVFKTAVIDHSTTSPICLCQILLQFIPEFSEKDCKDNKKQHHCK